MAAGEASPTAQPATAEVAASPESAPGYRYPDLETVIAAQDQESASAAVSNQQDVATDAEVMDGDAQMEETADSDESVAAESESDTADSDESDDDAATPEPKLSRPAQTRQELEAARVDLEKHRTEAEQARADLATFKADQTRTQQEAVASLGDDARFGDLHEKYEAYKKIGWNPDDYMDADELGEYRQMLPQRQHAAALMGIAEQSLRAKDQASLTATVKEFNLKADEFIGVDSATAVRQAIAATEARLRSDWADEKARFEADITSLATKSAGRSKAPGPAGASDAGARHVGMEWDPQRRGTDNLDAVIAKSLG